MLRFHRLRKDETGQSIVELALVLPVLIIILFGILEFGRIFHSYMVITHAAREGARTGAIGRPDSEIVMRIQEAAPLPQAETNLHITKIEPSEAARSSGLPLTVEVTYDVYLVTPLFSEFLPDPVTLTARAVMRLE